MAAPVPIYVGDDDILTEIPQSGEITLEQKSTWTRIYEGTYDLCKASMLPRGVLGTGDLSGWVVAKSTVTRDRGQKGRLTIYWEAGADAGQPLPPDDFSLDPFEVNPKVERHPLFTILTPDDRKTIKGYLEGSSSEDKTTFVNKIATIAPSTNAALASKLIKKIEGGQETYYLAGYKYSWSYHSYTLPALSEGGVLETPGGPISSRLSGDLASFTWLRVADAWAPVGVNGGAYKITNSWVGGPNGYWDPDLYF